MADDDVTGTDWSRTELDLIVADYFAMLKEEQAGQRYSKTEHLRALMEHLHRGDGPGNTPDLVTDTSFPAPAPGRARRTAPREHAERTPWQERSIARCA